MALAALRYRIGTLRRDRARVAFYRGFVRAGELAFDVGAHVGERTRLLRLAGARVVAVEPQAALADKLRRAFAGDPGVVVVEAALGAEPGTAELRLPPGGQALASLSDEWIERVRGSGRFGAEWTETVPVPVTTLETLIDEHGTPAFCKIDVEGFEDAVLRGLRTPVRALALEFTREHLDATERSLDLLAALGAYRFNYAIGDSLELVEPSWTERDVVLGRLRESPPLAFGDLYARLG